MKKGLTELIFILDKSGSMEGRESDVVGGFNTLIQKQKDEGEALVTLILFSDSESTVFDRAEIQSIPKMEVSDFCPNGSTALFDAIGNTIKKFQIIHKYIREEDVPEKTILVISTDGHENASRLYSREYVKSLVNEQITKRQWDVLFTAADIDAKAEAQSIGIPAGCYVEMKKEQFFEDYSNLSDQIALLRKRREKALQKHLDLPKECTRSNEDAVSDKNNA